MGEWEPPVIDNPEYEGEWKANRIDNPDYKDDESLNVFKMSGVGFELWQVVSGTIFDNIVITDDVKEAEEWAAKWETNSKLEKDAEQAFKDAQEADEVVEEDDDEDEDEDDKDEL